MTKPSRFLENGLAAACGRIVLRRQRRQQGEADQRFRIDRAVGRHAQRRVGLAAADRLDAELDRGGARRAGGRQRDRRALGAEGLGEMVGDRAEQEAPVVGGEAAAAGHAQHVVVGNVGPLAGRFGDHVALRPFQLDRGDGQEQRPGKVALLPIAAWAIASSATMSASRSDSAGDENGSTGTKSTVPATVVCSPSVGNRVMVRMPDWPAASLAQLSVLPAPSDVATPMPVTTTIGRPKLSRVASCCPRRLPSSVLLQ